MPSRMLAVVSLTVAISLAGAEAASAKWYGSTLRGKPNATWGCEAALTLGPVLGYVLSPTNQRSCTYYHAGYLFTQRRTALVPGNGRINRIKIKSGPRPAKLRLTILTGSSRVNPFNGRDQPGTYTCCTARYTSRPFRVRANATTTKKVNVRVYDVRDKRLRFRIHSTDIVALSAASPGRLPLRITEPGSFANGTPGVRGYWPRTSNGDPRVDGYAMQGVDLLMAWNWVRR